MKLKRKKSAKFAKYFLARKTPLKIWNKDYRQSSGSRATLYLVTVTNRYLDLFLISIDKVACHCFKRMIILISLKTQLSKRTSWDLQELLFSCSYIWSSVILQLKCSCRLLLQKNLRLSGSSFGCTTKTTTTASMDFLRKVYLVLLWCLHPIDKAMFIRV